MQGLRTILLIMCYRLVRTIKKLQFMNNINLLECIGKFFIFQNDDFRRAYNAASRSKAIGIVNNLTVQREYWQNLAASVSANMIPNISQEDRFSLLRLCNYHIHRCNVLLEQLVVDTIKNETISKLAQIYTHKR